MAISASVPSDPLVVEPGGSATLNLEVRNLGDESEPIEVALEGLDPEWVALPQPTLTVAPGETARVIALLRPPRTSESAAGEYPFLARVRSLRTQGEGSGDAKTSTAILRVKPYHHLSVEIAPRKGFITATRKANTFEVTVANLGNAEHTLSLAASDPEDACAYEFDHESVTLGPGMQTVVGVTVNPRHRSAVASSRLIAFTVTARSTETANAAASSQAQLEVRPFLTPAGLVFLLFVAALLGVLWFLQPKPPRITALTVEPNSVMQGQKVTVSWRSEGANGVQLRVGGVPLPGSLLGPEGSKQIDVKDPGQVTISAAPMRDNTVGTEQIATVEVTTPVAAPEPKIVTLDPSAKQVRMGQSFVLKYKFNEAVVKAKISPLGRDLDLSLDSIQIPVDTPTTMQYTVVAENKDGKQVRKSFTIEVTDPSNAVIADVSATPKELDAGGGTVTLRWTTTGAAALKVTYEGKEEDLPTLSGERELAITKSGKITLRAVDARGKEVRRSVSVKVKPTVAVQPATNDPANGPTNDPANAPGVDPGLGPH